jgi:serpin B
MQGRYGQDGNQMSTMVLPRLTFVSVLMAAFLAQSANSMAAGDLHGLALGNDTFAWDLYGKVEHTERNLFFSPYSISACLAMTYAGARGETATQMAQTLHFSTNQDQLATGFGQLQKQLQALEQKQAIALRVANGLWCQQGHPFLPAFLDVARTTYQASVDQVDFRTQAEPTRVEINDWVSRQTQGKITHLLQPGMVDPTTRLILVNAIYFKGKWAHQFNPTNTTNAPFSVTPSRSVQAPLMHLNAEFNYAEVDGAQLLELPYAGGDLSMVVLLPKERDGLKTLESSLSQPKLEHWLGRGREQKVNVFLPKFKLTAQFSLGRTLADLGMRDAFSPAADFSGMDGARDLFISAVVHKAFVDVNEEGTEAAAATGTVMKMLAIRPQPVPTFRADHPFLFLIRDTHSGSILFLGRVLDPTQGL